MASFQKYYRTLFDTFGYPLTERTALSPNVIAAAEKRLGVRIPAALRDYYLVAGRERRFNTSHNRVLAPQKWTIDKQRLIFMEENQQVVWWAISTRNAGNDDPPIYQAVDDEPLTWVREHRKCSVFLAVMLHYQAVGGAYGFQGYGQAPRDVKKRLQKAWTFCGVVNGLRAYSRANQVVCHMLEEQSVLAGGKTARDLRAIGQDLGVNLT
jgi:hypothetical protein